MKNSSNASSACVTDICDDVFLGLTSKVDYVQEGGIPLVRANNMTNGVLSFNDVKYISEEQHKKLTKNHKVQKGDILIICSDGLTNMVDIDEIYKKINENFEYATKELIEKANLNGGLDNITIITVKNL